MKRKYYEAYTLFLTHTHYDYYYCYYYFHFILSFEDVIS